jgi:hypothetical protein
VLRGEARACLIRADECRRAAEKMDDPFVRADYLDMEDRWLRLAKSYEIAEHLRHVLAKCPTSGSVSNKDPCGVE